MRKILLYILLVLLCVPCAFSAENAQAVFNRVAAQCSGNHSVRSSFTLSSAQGSVKGSVIISGNKFAITTSGGSTWFNGRDMWTYNPQTSETTITTPSARELAEVNPLLYITSNYKRYKAEFGSNAPKGCKSLILTPKSGKGDFRRAVLTVNSRSLAPQKLVVSTHQGDKITISLSGFNSKASVKASDFQYSQKRYPKAKIIDLR